jgi:hypothetical protein
MTETTYVIVYNAETDFVKVYGEGQLQGQIEELIKDGSAQNDIEVYKEIEVDIEVDAVRVVIN